jgi:uncharacterized protein YPO0396
MLIPQTSHLNGTNQKAHAGYRLARLEIYNWGTFSGRWKLDLGGETSLLTGANGSGKSTLVDALLTLLVPNQGRNYNQAAGSGGKQERDEQSYVRGAYGQVRAEDGTSGRVQYLRDKDSYTVLLAVFENPFNKTHISLARVFWFQPDFHRFFLVAKEALSIEEHFQLSGEMKVLKAQLKKNPNISIYEQFKDYSAQFRKLFYLRSEKALDLFNQIVAIKEIGGLNDFVRRHMLESIDVQSHISDLQANYENLNRAYDAIQKAEEQANLLRPLLEEAERYQKQKERIEEVEAIIEVLPHFFNQERVELYENAIADSREKLTHWQSEAANLNQERDKFRENLTDLEIAIRQDKAGQRLSELEKEIQTATRLMNERKAEARKYLELTKAVSLSEVQSTADFSRNQTEASQRREKLEQAIEKLADEKQDFIQKERDLRSKIEELRDEIEELSKRKSQIPPNDLKVRQLIADALAIDENDLPFIGELLKVREEAEVWEAAIERLLNGFARQMLVPDGYYQRLSSFVDKNNLRGRLIYHRIQDAKAPSLGHLRDESLYRKLQIKPETEFHDWLSSQLLQRYDYICCKDLRQFQHEERALSLNGQIKHGGNRHEKDDRHNFGDRRHYVLGWDNQEKLAALEREYHEKLTEQDALINQIKDLERKEKSYREASNNLLLILNYSDFSRLDWYSPDAAVRQYQAEKTQLESAANHLQVLQGQLKELKAKVSQADADIARLQSIIGTHENEIKRYQNEGRKAEIALEFVQIQRYEKPFAEIRKQVETELSIDSINEVERQRTKFYNDSKASQSGRLNNYQASIIQRIAQYKNAYAAETQDIDASVQSIGWFQSKYEQIERDDLPKHRERFRELMNRNVIQSISIFQENLNQHERDIKASIDQLNESLRTIPFTGSTYIQLVYQRNPDREIQSFRADLAECYPKIADDRDAANEIAFKNIRALIKLFEKEERWTQKVSDVRNWLDFSAEERWNDDHSLKEHYDSSSGKSGGQKAKLAYTILASAIAYQYRLDDEDERNKTFRFVVVDEVFSKSDEQNSRFAMELFRQLDLQVLVVTPSDKVRVVEPYIGTCHFVTNNEEGNHSRVRTLTIQELKEQQRR